MHRGGIESFVFGESGGIDLLELRGVATPFGFGLRSIPLIPKGRPETAYQSDRRMQAKPDSDLFSNAIKNGLR